MVSRTHPAASALALGLSFSVVAQEKPPTFRSRVEVSVRTVRVVLTGKDGKPLLKPPSPNDLEVLEGGQKAEILDVERLFTVSSEAEPGTAPKPADAAPAPAPKPVPHVVYLETTFLSTPAVKEASRALDALASRLVASGTVEIVVADPEPRTVLPPTREPAAVRSALEKISATVPGRDWLAQQRAQDADNAASTTGTEESRIAYQDAETRSAHSSAAFASPSDDSRNRAKSRAREAAERNAVVIVLDSLVRWAGRRAPQPGGVFVLVSDGYDLDPARFSERLAGNDAGAARHDPRGPDAELRALTADASALLGSLGFAIFPLAVGPERFQRTAESGGRTTVRFDGLQPGKQALTTVLEGREEPLALAAAATGGEVATTGDQLGKGIERLAESYVITFQPAIPADGKVHALAVRSKREDMVVRAPSSVSGGTAESTARALTLAILQGAAPPSELAVEPSIERDAAAKTSMLKLRIRIGPALDLLSGAKGRLRISVAVARAKDAPFVKHDDVPLVGGGEGRIFVFEAPIAGFSAGDRAAVLVEELETGLLGGATITGESAPGKKQESPASTKPGS